jgi:hypothetical protein
LTRLSREIPDTYARHKKLADQTGPSKRIQCSIPLQSTRHSGQEFTVMAVNPRLIVMVVGGTDMFKGSSLSSRNTKSDNIRVSDIIIFDSRMLHLEMLA